MCLMGLNSLQFYFDIHVISKFFHNPQYLKMINDLSKILIRANNELAWRTQYC